MCYYKHSVSPLPISFCTLSNIKPTRELLRGNDGQQSRRVPWFPYAPVCIVTCSNVAVGMAEDSKAVEIRTQVLIGEPADLAPLEHIMNVPPLLDAFADFCQRALCCEVRGSRFLPPAIRFNAAGH